MADKTFLDWPFFEPWHRELASAVDNWASRELVEVDHHDLDATCRRLVRRLGEGGWLKFAAPEEGSKHDVRALALIRETLSQRSGLADFAFALQGLGSAPISLFGSDEMRAKWLPQVRDGKAICAFALSELEAGSDVAALATTAVREGDGYRITGSKTWISNGGIADYYIVFARTGEAPGAKGLSAFLVEADRPGWRVSERIDVIAPHPLASLEFIDCRVPAANLIGSPGDGFKIAMSTLDIFRPTVGAAALGFARRALDEALQRSLDRKLFGAPLADMQTTQANLAEMATSVDASALLVYRAAWAKDKGAARITREASMAKLFSTESAQKVIDMAVQMFGALGVVSGQPVEELYREIRALRIYEGASEVQRQIIARQVLTAFQEAQ